VLLSNKGEVITQNILMFQQQVENRFESIRNLIEKENKKSLRSLNISDIRQEPDSFIGRDDFFNPDIIRREEERIREHKRKSNESKLSITEELEKVYNDKSNYNMNSDNINDYNINPNEIKQNERKEKVRFDFNAFD